MSAGMSQGTDVMLLSETRQQNTEVRLTLSKMSDKVDQVLQKVIGRCYCVVSGPYHGHYICVPAFCWQI